MEYVLVAIPQLKYGVIVSSQVRLGIFMNTGPMVKTELHVIHLAVQ